LLCQDKEEIGCRQKAFAGSGQYHPRNVLSTCLEKSIPLHFLFHVDLLGMVEFSKRQEIESRC